MHSFPFNFALVENAVHRPWEFILFDTSRDQRSPRVMLLRSHIGIEYLRMPLEIFLRLSRIILVLRRRWWLYWTEPEARRPCNLYSARDVNIIPPMPWTKLTAYFKNSMNELRNWHFLISLCPQIMMPSTNPRVASISRLPYVRVISILKSLRYLHLDTTI